MTDRSGASYLPRQALIIFALILGVLLVWQLRDVLLLTFAGILFAIILGAAARGLERRLGLGRRSSLAIASTLIAAAIGGAIWLFGREIAVQLSELLSRLPAAWADLRERIGAAGLEAEFRGQLGRILPDGSTVLDIIRFVVSGLTGAVSGVALALLGGIYLAANPEVYRRGVLLMVPDRHDARLERALDATGDALRAWLLGQLVSMAMTAVAITGGLVAIGVPSPLALGLICGLMGFVPMIGPLLGALPGVLVALTIGGEVLLQTVLLYFVVQQLAGAVIEPLIMQRTVKLPPALTLFGLFGIGGLLGPIGVLLGGPLLVTGYVLTRQLYVRDTLGHQL